MMLSWNGNLYIKKNRPPKYLQTNFEVRRWSFGKVKQVSCKDLGDEPISSQGIRMLLSPHTFKWLSSANKTKNNKNEVITHTKTPVTIDVMKVPKIAKTQIAPKLEKNGFWKINKMN